MAVARFLECRVVKTDDISLSGAATVDNVDLLNGDEVLAVGQTATKDNGVWVVNSGPWTRAPEASSTQDFRGMTVVVREGMTAGTNKADTMWQCVTEPITVGSPGVNGDPIEFVRIPARTEHANLLSEPAVLGDADAILAVAGGKRLRIPADTLKKDRTATLSTTAAVAGDRLTFYREDRSRWLYRLMDDASGKTLHEMAPASHAEIYFDGTQWNLATASKPSASRVQNVREHGAKGDGKIDDRAAIQAAIHAAFLDSGDVYFPPGTYRITSTLDVKDGDVPGGSQGPVRGIRIHGDQVGDSSIAATTLRWDGPDGIPMVAFHTRDSELSNLAFRCAPCKAPSCAIEIDESDQPNALRSTNNLFTHLQIIGNLDMPSNFGGLMEDGIVIGPVTVPPGAPNLEFNTFEHCHIEGVQNACVNIPSDTFNAKSNVFRHCHFNSSPYAVRMYRGSVQLYDCSMGGITDTGLALENPAEQTVVENMQAEWVNRFLLVGSSSPICVEIRNSRLDIGGMGQTPITPVRACGVKPPPVTLTGTPTGTYRLRIEITTGGDLGTALFKWSTNNGKSFVETDVSMASDVLLTGTGITAHFSAPVAPDKYTNNNVYTSRSTVDYQGNFILTSVVGMLKLSNVKFGFNYAWDDKFRVAHGQAHPISLLIVEGCQFPNSTPFSVGPGGAYQRRYSRGNFARSAGGWVLLDDEVGVLMSKLPTTVVETLATTKISNNVEQPVWEAIYASPTTTVDFNNGTIQRITLTGASTTVAFAHLKAGPIRIIVKQNSFGGQALNWPAAAVFIDGATGTVSSAPNAVDVFEGISDGTNIYFDRVKVTGTAPISVSSSGVVSISAATQSAAGSLSSADKTKLDTRLATAPSDVATTGAVNMGNAEAVMAKTASGSDLRLVRTLSSNAAILGDESTAASVQVRCRTAASGGFGFIILDGITTLATIIGGGGGASFVAGGGLSFLGLKANDTNQYVAVQALGTSGHIDLEAKSHVSLKAGTKEGLRVGVTGTDATVGFYGHTPVARSGAYTLSHSGANATHTAYMADNQSTGYAPAVDGEAKYEDLEKLRIAYETLRAAYESTAAVLNQVILDLKANGLLQ